MHVCVCSWMIGLKHLTCSHVRMGDTQIQIQRYKYKDVGQMKQQKKFSHFWLKVSS